MQLYTSLNLMPVDSQGLRLITFGNHLALHKPSDQPPYKSLAIAPGFLLDLIFGFSL